MNRESFSVKSLGASLNRAERKTQAKIAEEAFGGDLYFSPRLSPVVTSGEEREWLALVYKDKPVAFATTTVDRNWIEKRKENVGFIDDFMILPAYKDGASILIEHCLSRLHHKGVERVMSRSRGTPALKMEEFDIPSPIFMPHNPPWYVDLFCESGFARDKKWVMLYIPSLPSSSKLSPQIEPDAQEFLRRHNAEFRRIDMGNGDEIKQYSDLVDEIFTPHFAYLPGGPAQDNSLWKRILMRLLRFRMYAWLINGKMVGHFLFSPDFTVATQQVKRGKWGGLFNPLNWISVIRFARSLRGIKRVHLQSVGFKQDIRKGWGYATAMLDYVIKILVDEGYQEAIIGPILVENLPSIKFATQKLVPKILEKEGYGTEERETVVKNLRHTIYNEKDASKAPESGGLNILRYCTLMYQF